MPCTTQGAHSWHSHTLPPAPAVPRPTPARCRLAVAREVFVLKCACFLFPPVFRPRDKQTWPGEGGEEQKKDHIPQEHPKSRLRCMQAFPPPIGCCGAQRKHPGALSPYRTGGISTSPALQAHPLPPCFSPSQELVQQGSAGMGTAQEGFRSCLASHRDAMGRRDHPETAPRGFHGIWGWRGGAEPNSDAGCRASSGVMMQNQLLPVTPAHKWVFLTGLPQAVLSHGLCLRSAGLP